MAGRPPDAGESRDKYLRVRLAPYEQTWVDQARDGQSQSDYIRHLIRVDAQERGFV